MGYMINVGISNKHIHVTKEDFEKLFGAGKELTVKKELSQPGQYAAEEQVTVVGPKGQTKLRILGPYRKETQVELAMTDARGLGITAPVRESGKLDGTPGCKLIGPCGEVEIDHGVMIAARHIHLSVEDGKEAGIQDKEIVKIVCPGERGLVFNNVIARVGSAYAADFHVDTDEANAAGLANGMMVEVIK